MFTIERTNWQKLIRDAEDERDKYFFGVNDLVNKFVGPYFKEGKTSSGVLENHASELVALLVPLLASGKPYSKMRSRLLGGMDKAMMFQLALNKVIAMTDMETVQEQFATDYCFWRAVSFVSLEERNFGWRETEDPVLWPTLMRVPWAHYIEDPSAYESSQARFKGHLIITDKDDLLDRADREDGWNREAIEAMTARAKFDKHKKDRYVDSKRNEVSYWQLWVPELENDDDHPHESGYNGQILTIGVGAQDQGLIRDPYPAFVPRWGAYGSVSAWVVPDDPMGLAPLVSDAPQAEDLEAISGAISDSAANYKRLAVVSRQGAALADLVRSGEHDGVLTANTDEIQKNLVQLELFGSTRWMHMYEEFARMRLDRKSGIFEALRGNVTGDATATENSLAQGGANTRFSHHQNKFKRFMVHNAKTIAWYLNAEESIEIDIAPEAIGRLKDPMTGSPYQREHLIELVFKGGGKDFRDDFDQYELDIDVFSMSMNAETYRQWRLMGIQWYIQTASQAAMLPHVHLDQIIREGADLFSMPEMLAWGDMAAGAEIGALQQMAGQSVQGGGGAGQVQPQAPKQPQMAIQQRPANASLPGKPRSQSTSQKFAPDRTGGAMKTILSED